MQHAGTAPARASQYTIQYRKISSSSNTQKSVVPAGKINKLQVTSAAVGGPIMFLFRVEF